MDATNYTEQNELALIRQIIVGEYEKAHQQKIQELEQRINQLNEQVRQLEAQSFENIFIKMMKVKQGMG